MIHPNLNAYGKSTIWGTFINNISNEREKFQVFNGVHQLSLITNTNVLFTLQTKWRLQLIRVLCTESFKVLQKFKGLSALSSVLPLPRWRHRDVLGRGKGRNLMSYLQNCPCFVDDDEMTNRRHLGRLNSIFFNVAKIVKERYFLYKLCFFINNFQENFT